MILQFEGKRYRAVIKYCYVGGSCDHCDAVEAAEGDASYNAGEIGDMNFSEFEELPASAEAPYDPDGPAEDPSKAKVAE
jgi:hypothetical protein